jgi:glycosyltransferase involved in cell wall biosynthesis
VSGPRAEDGERSLAFVLWGDLFEDFFDTIEVDLDRFRDELTGGWLFGYVDALASAGIRTTLFHVSARVSEPQRFTHAATGAPVVILPAPRRHRWLRALHRRVRRKALSSLASYGSVPVRALLRELRGIGAEAILTQEYEHARFDILVLVGRLADVPVFASFQGGDAPHSRLESLVRPLAISRCAGLIIGSLRERARVLAGYGVAADRIAAIPNALDAQKFAPLIRSAARAQLAIPDDACVVEWHGRVVVHRKGLDVLIQAWQAVCEQRPEAALLLLLVGTGPDAQRFRAMIDDTGLDSIRWRDAYVVDRAELRAYLTAADVYVLPSRHEGFPVAPREAMAAEIPVVAADAPGVDDILPEGERCGGIVVPRDDARSLAAALGRLIDDPELRLELGRRARQRVEEQYDLGVVGARLRAFMFPDDLRR